MPSVVSEKSANREDPPRPPNEIPEDLPPENVPQPPVETPPDIPQEDVPEPPSEQPPNIPPDSPEPGVPVA